MCVGSDKDCSGVEDDCNGSTCNAGTCTAVPMTGSGCDDGDECTENDSCNAGICSGSLLDCSGVEDDCNGSTCNGGICTAVPMSGTTCDDADVCSVGDTCTSGSCSGASTVAVTCPAAVAGLDKRADTDGFVAVCLSGLSGGEGQIVLTSPTGAVEMSKTFLPSVPGSGVLVNPRDVKALSDGYIAVSNVTSTDVSFAYLTRFDASGNVTNRPPSAEAQDSAEQKTLRS